MPIGLIQCRVLPETIDYFSKAKPHGKITASTAVQFVQNDVMVRFGYQNLLYPVMVANLIALDLENFVGLIA